MITGEYTVQNYFVIKTRAFHFCPQVVSTEIHSQHSQNSKLHALVISLQGTAGEEWLLQGLMFYTVRKEIEVFSAPLVYFLDLSLLVKYLRKTCLLGTKEKEMGRSCSLAVVLAIPLAWISVDQLAHVCCVQCEEK